jgi:hypothetical protein
MPTNQGASVILGPRLALLGHIKVHVTKIGGGVIWGLKPIFLYRVGFILCFWDFLIDFGLLLVDFAHFWGILGIFGGQILGGSWERITNFIYKKTRPF